MCQEVAQMRYVPNRDGVAGLITSAVMTEWHDPTPLNVPVSDLLYQVHWMFQLRQPIQPGVVPIWTYGPSSEPTNKTTFCRMKQVGSQWVKDYTLLPGQNESELCG
jgi:hypothetical protein